MKIEFIETTFFTKRVCNLLSDYEYSELQNDLSENPERGRLIQGGKGIRKIRVPLSGRGKRGGARAIYYFKKNDQQIYMLLIYSKKEQDDLTPEQVEILAKLVEKELK